MTKIRWHGTIFVALVLALGAAMTTPTAAQVPDSDGGQGSVSPELGATGPPVGCSTTAAPPDFGIWGGTFYEPNACAQCVEHGRFFDSFGYDGYCWRVTSEQVELWLRSRPPVNMESIPGTDGRELGWAFAGDTLLPFCWMADNHNMRWVLVINRNGHGGIQYENTIGFVPEASRTWKHTYWDCYPRYQTTITSSFLGNPIFQVDMESIPGTDGREAGLARPGQELWALCSLRDNHNMRWDLVINRSGISGIQQQNSVGFVPYNYTVGSYSLRSCYQIPI